MNKKLLIVASFVVVALVIASGAYWTIYLRKAHSTFDNYYKFRGCTQLITKTDTYGTCQLKNGNTIKIVKYKGKWYLDGDLPMCWAKICL
jgi:hypothetical protein